MKPYSANPNLTEPRWLRVLLTAVALGFLLLMLVVPLAAVFYEALKGGWDLYLQSLTDPEAWAAIKLTLITAAVVVPVNAVLGVAMAWLLTRFDFRGKQLLTTLLDLPFSVSPVVAGLMFVLLFGAHTALGGWLEAQGIQIIFAIPGIILATLFVTFPFVAREIIPLMQAQGDSEEQAALILGASGWQMFWRVTLPNIKWALLYGIIHQMGAALRHHPHQRPRDGRIRRSQRGIGTHPRRNQHHPAFGRNLLQRIQLHRRIRPLRRIGTLSTGDAGGAEHHHQITR